MLRLFRRNNSSVLVLPINSDTPEDSRDSVTSGNDERNVYICAMFKVIILSYFSIVLFPTYLRKPMLLQYSTYFITSPVLTGFRFFKVGEWASLSMVS